MRLRFAGGERCPSALDAVKTTWPDGCQASDLVVEAVRSGPEQYLVVKDRAGAALVSALSMPWRTTGLPEHQRDNAANPAAHQSCPNHDTLPD